MSSTGPFSLRDAVLLLQDVRSHNLRLLCSLCHGAFTAVLWDSSKVFHNMYNAGSASPTSKMLPI